MTKSVVVYLPEGFADWEGAFIMPELKEVKRNVITVSETGESVNSIGGLKVLVNDSLSSINPENTEALILIGSDTWTDAKLNQVALDKALEFLKKDILVAGICGATVGLARAGAYENYKHTSNAIEFMNYFVPTYAGKEGYEEKMVLRDKNLITAPGVGFLEFTLEIMAYLNIYTDVKRSQWYALYKNGVRPPMDFWES